MGSADSGKSTGKSPLRVGRSSYPKKRNPGLLPEQPEATRLEIRINLCELNDVGVYATRHFKHLATVTRMNPKHNLHCLSVIGDAIVDACRELQNRGNTVFSLSLKERG
jgi:hypothetical protein